MELVGYRRLIAFISSIIVVTVLSVIKSSDAAYLALSACVTTFFGASWIEQWKTPKNTSDSDVSAPKV